jgi:non-ribosomal peptide synthetase component F
VIVAGEACPTGLVRRHSDALPDVALWNEYGPTEATVWSTAYRIPRGFDGARIPIGRPVAGARVHVLGTDGQPAPIGVPGELWIGGAGVATYLGGEEGDRPRFVADPFSTEPGAQLYRTGDVARWRDDGLLEFMGRTDQQVKVRGHRIEPAEIEAVLRRHTAVRDVVVGVRTASPQGAGVAHERDRLVAALRALEPAEAERLLALAEGIPGLEASA